MIDLCNRARELNTSTNPNYRNIFNNQKQSTSMGRVYQSPYHFNDPFLPDYVAPPPPIALESVAKPTRIGHRHSIYRVGEDKSTELENGDNRRKAVYRGALIDALQPMFGLEKVHFHSTVKILNIFNFQATALVNGNPDQNEINDLIELGINQ